MSEAYPNRTVYIADKFYLKDGVSVKKDDVLAKTGSTVNGRIEVDKMSASYKQDDVIGVTPNKMDADYPDRAITVAVKGPIYVKLAKAVTINQSLQGSTGVITEYFSGDGTAQQTVYLGAVPISTVTSVIEDPTGTPTVLTRVTTTPSTDEYYLNDETGELIIGGTSVSGTDNYQVIYSIDSGRLEPSTEWQEETITVTTNVGTLSYEPEFIEYVEGTGTSGGNKGIITSGTVAAGEVKLDRSAKTLTFFATDAITSAIVRYKAKHIKPCARALESKNAGEICKVYFEGVEAL